MLINRVTNHNEIIECEKLMKNIFSDYYKEFYNNDSYEMEDCYDNLDENERPFYFAIKIDGKIVGAIRALSCFSGIEISKFCVLPGYRSDGCGTSLLHFAEDYMYKKYPNLARFYLATNINSKAVKFYIDNGYHILSVSTNGRCRMSKNKTHYEYLTHKPVTRFGN